MYVLLSKVKENVMKWVSRVYLIEVYCAWCILVAKVPTFFEQYFLFSTLLLFVFNQVISMYLVSFKFSLWFYISFCGGCSPTHRMISIDLSSITFGIRASPSLKLTLLIISIMSYLFYNLSYSSQCSKWHKRLSRSLSKFDKFIKQSNLVIVYVPHYSSLQGIKYALISMLM